MSMLLGAAVIILVGFLLVNYFRKLDTGETIPAIGTEDTTVQLPAQHVVSAGEDLWNISETYYGTGYNWVDISEANQITNPGLIEEGQKLLIPDVESRTLGKDLAQADTQINEPTPTQIDQPTPKQKVEQPSTISQDETLKPQVLGPSQQKIIGNSYTVVRGDTLWDIAERAYGDGFRWGDIAKENKLANPDLIHSGNVFILPR